MILTETNGKIVKIDHHYETRYVRAALRAFARGGYHGTSMDNIASEAGVSQPRVSQVFDGKMSAYRAAHRLALAAVVDAIKEVPGSRFEPGKVRTALDALTDDQPEVMMMLFHSITAGSSDSLLTATARATLAGLGDALIAHGATREQARNFLGDLLVTLVSVAADVDGDTEPAVEWLASPNAG